MQFVSLFHVRAHPPAFKALVQPVGVVLAFKGRHLKDIVVELFLGNRCAGGFSLARSRIGRDGIPGVGGGLRGGLFAALRARTGLFDTPGGQTFATGTFKRIVRACPRFLVACACADFGSDVGVPVC